MENVNTINLDGKNYPIEDTEARKNSQAALSLLGSDPSALGTNLATAFAAEIAAAPFSGNVWAWIKARIQAGNFVGINIGDSIPLRTTDGIDFNMEIAGINTYKGYGWILTGETGEHEVPNHIDFISRELHPETTRFNPANFNNGTTVNPSPWLASELYLKLNSKSGQVPNATTHTPALIAANFSASGGILDKLPAAAQAVIVEKRLYLPSRYTVGALLIDDNAGAWQDAGKLWLPSEMEIYGTNIWGSVASPEQGRATMGFQQYPLFAENMRRVKRTPDGARAHWWLLSAFGGISTRFARVNSGGFAGYNTASLANRVPLCFRIA
jgi:hypothetical protein